MFHHNKQKRRKYSESSSKTTDSEVLTWALCKNLTIYINMYMYLYKISMTIVLMGEVASVLALTLIQLRFQIYKSQFKVSINYALVKICRF